MSHFRLAVQDYLVAAGFVHDPARDHEDYSFWHDGADFMVEFNEEHFCVYVVYYAEGEEPVLEGTSVESLIDYFATEK